MSDKQAQLEQLKQHFGRRVHEQARTVVNSWSALQDVHWNDVWFNEFHESAGKLMKLAGRYEFDQLTKSTTSLINHLIGCKPEKAPNSEMLEKLNTAITHIAEACSRTNDSLPVQQISAGRKPVYICLLDAQEASILQEQLGFFGIPSKIYDDPGELEKSILYRLPAAIICETEFGGDGVALIARMQSNLRQTIPIIFYSANEPSIETRLQTVRAEGIAYFVGQVDMGMLVEQLTGIYSLRTEPPFRVLVVDDSRSQAIFAEKTLNQAGIFTRTVNQPLEVLGVIDEFSPDAILMDMYMPGCTGPEVAQVIRQQEKYDGIPILYLSAESDVEKQLEAVGLGGDDFLTKPVQREVLISTVRNRCRRYRGLRDQMIRDSLTGLVDHNHILAALDKELIDAQKEGELLCFVMLDIDYFKKVNDQFGHSMGDKVIRALALYLRQRFRMTDTIGRYGGEEFAIVLPALTEEMARGLLDEVREGFAKLVHQEGDNKISSTFSCGIAAMREGDTSSELSMRTDTALYAAKHAGRNQVAIYSELKDVE